MKKLPKRLPVFESGVAEPVNDKEKQYLDGFSDRFPVGEVENFQEIYDLIINAYDNNENAAAEQIKRTLPSARKAEFKEYYNQNK